MKKTFKVKGMTCNSCAMLIEKKLKDKVNSVSVSFSDEKAKIDYNPDKITEAEIKEILKNEGYELKEELDAQKTKEKTDYTKWIVLGGTALFAILVLYYMFGNSINFSSFKLPELQVPQFSQNTSLILLFLVGLLTGFHCISMCGAFVVSYTAKNAIDGHKGFMQHLFYGGGKLISYTIIGGIFGLVGGIFAFSAGLRGWVAVIAGIFMIFYALSIFGIKFFRRFQFNPKFLTKFASSTSAKAGGFYKRPAITGLLNGLFIACGPLQAMYLFAAGSGSFISGATSLFAFGLGTLPVMLGFGSLASVISHKTTKKILKLSAIIVLILGLIMLNRGLALTGVSITSIIPLSQSSTITNANAALIQDGVQIINMDVDGSGYSPNSFVLQKGIPVKWNVNVKELTNCNNEIIVNAYGIDKKLTSGLNIIEFTPDKTGTIPFSCWMGMLRGSFIVTENGQATPQEIQTATPLKGSSCGCGG